MENHRLAGICNCSLCCLYRAAQSYLLWPENKSLKGVDACVTHGIYHVGNHCKSDPSCRLVWYPREGQTIREPEKPPKFFEAT